MEVDINAFQVALNKVKDGWIFEEFSQKFLAARLGYEFIPVGGTKDKGIDSFEKIFSREDKHTKIFQISIEKTNYLKKIRDTLQKLEENQINIDSLTYVTNQKVINKDMHIDTLHDESGTLIQIWDISWFEANVTYNAATINAYHWLVENSFHILNNPTKTLTVGNLDQDPRLYIFLRQQMERDPTENLNSLLIDTLILFYLEGTDPDKDKFKTDVEIKKYVKSFLKNNDISVDADIQHRLITLCKKPRKVKFHTKGNGYCLPYETRIEIHERNINDIALRDTFMLQSEEILQKYLDKMSIRVKDLTKILELLLNKLFYTQGLEFANVYTWFYHYYGGSIAYTDIKICPMYKDSDHFERIYEAYSIRVP